MKPGRKNTHKPNAARKPAVHNATSGPWPLLWQAWQAQPAGTHLDRWLRANLSRLVPAPGAHSALVARLHKAVALQQLLCALAHQFETGKSTVDWTAWDRQWQPAQVARLSALQVEQWLDLRLNPEPSTVAPGQARKVALVQAFRAAIPESDAHAALWHGLRPAWMPAVRERARLGGWGARQLNEFLAAQLNQPPLWLRLQPEVAPEQALAQLAADGVLAELSAQGLCAHGGKSIHQSQLFRSGALEIQDLASQQLAAKVAAAPGQKVWDVCAGAGGKSLAIAAGLKNKGMLLATDINERKLQELKRRAKRAGVFNVRSFGWNADAPLVLPREVAQQGGFDWVLVDAPCSASGTWRRNPEARWRYTDADTVELVQLQRRIVDNALPALRPGGHLVYATCSWDARENEQQVEALLAGFPGLSLTSSELLGCPHMDSDTMFVAVFVNTAQV